MTDAIVAATKKQIDGIVDGARKDSEISLMSARWRIIMMAASINQDAIMGLIEAEKGVTEQERLELQDYNRNAYERLRV